MKNKSIFIMNIIRSIIFILILLFPFFHNTGFARIIIVPFLICGFAVMAKNICFLINQVRLANLFHKLYVISFFLFGFSFLIVWSYSAIKSGDFISLLFTIPFWLIGIYMLRKSLFPKEQETSETKKKLNFDPRIIVGGFLVGFTLLTGIVLFVIGIKDTYQLNQTTKNYVTTDGYFVDYDIYSSDEDGVTYKLIYTYRVEDSEYTVSTDYGVGSIPEQNSIRKVNYDPADPSKAVLVGTNNNNFLIYFGLFFILGSMVFILAWLQMKGVFDRFKIDVMGLYFGIVFFLIGIGILFFQGGLSSSFLESLKALGLWVIIPILFIVVGLFQTIKCLFLWKANHLMSK